MEIRFNQADVIGELSLSQGVVERRTTIPALGNVKLEAFEDGKVKITATDLEVGLVSSFDADVRKAGTLLLPARKVYEYIAELPSDQPVILKATDKGVNFTSGRSRARFPLYGGNDFPELPEPGQVVASIPAQLFSYALSTVAFAISNEEAKFTISGVFLQLSATGFLVSATDGHRCGVFSYPVAFENISKPKKVIIPTKAVNEIMKLAGKSDKDSLIDIYIAENHLHFRIGSHVLYSRTNSQKYPDFERVFLTGEKKTVITDSIALRSAVNRVGHFADQRSKAIRFIVDGENGLINTSIANNENGDGEESVDATFADPHTYEVGIKSDYLSDFLKVAAGKPVRFSYKDGARSVECNIEGDSMYRHTIATMTI